MTEPHEPSESAERGSSPRSHSAGSASAVEEGGSWGEHGSPHVEHQWLGKSVTLVYMPDDVERAVNPKYGESGDIVSFADGYPVLLASTSSLDDLNARLDEPVPMDRFRPNLVAVKPPKKGRLRRGIAAVQRPHRVHIRPCASAHHNTNVDAAR